MNYCFWGVSRISNENYTLFSFRVWFNAFLNFLAFFLGNYGFFLCSALLIVWTRYGFFWVVLQWLLESQGSLIFVDYLCLLFGLIIRGCLSVLVGDKLDWRAKKKIEMLVLAEFWAHSMFAPETKSVFFSNYNWPLRPGANPSWPLGRRSAFFPNLGRNQSKT